MSKKHQLSPPPWETSPTQPCLLHIEVEVLTHLVDAIGSLQIAARQTELGFVADHCANAVEEIRKAIRHAGG